VSLTLAGGLVEHERARRPDIAADPAVLLTPPASTPNRWPFTHGSNDEPDDDKNRIKIYDIIRAKLQ
jgi:hypothetical protein